MTTIHFRRETVKLFDELLSVCSPRFLLVVFLVSSVCGLLLYKFVQISIPSSSLEVVSQPLKVPKLRAELGNANGESNGYKARSQPTKHGANSGHEKQSGEWNP